MEAYRDDLLSTREVQELLGLDDRFAVYDLCKKYDIVLYTLEDLEAIRKLTSNVVPISSRILAVMKRRAAAGQRST
jgi:hypothetical protein